MNTCTYSECAAKRISRGLCRHHYNKWHNGKLPDYTPPAKQTICAHCDEKVAAKGLCEMHYKRHQKGTPMGQPKEVHIEGRTCTIDGCGRKHVSRGLCATHDMRRKRGVEVDAPVLSRLHTDDLAERLNLYAPPGEPDECWEWTRARTKNYGTLSVGRGRSRNAHVVAWELHTGLELPADMLIRHTCDNPPCCNPAHLMLGTHADNIADKVERQRQSRGETHGNAKLSDDDIREIRRLYELGTQQKAIAKWFGTTQTNVSCIVRGVTWSHVA